MTAPRTYEPGDEVPAKRVAVMDLKVTGDYSGQLAEYLPTLIEDRLLRAGWTLVARGDRMRHVQEEQNLPGVRPETRPPDQELLGATALFELTARVHVEGHGGLFGYSVLSGAEYVRASVDLNGQIVDTATGVLKASLNVGGSASGLKSALILDRPRRWRRGGGAIGFDVRGIRETLVGKAGDKAAEKLVARLNDVYPALPGSRVEALQPTSTTVGVEHGPATILLDIPKTLDAQPGDRFGIYRGDELIAEVEILRFVGPDKAEAKIISQNGPIKPTDKARRMPLTIKAE